MPDRLAEAVSLLEDVRNRLVECYDSADETGDRWKSRQLEELERRVAIFLMRVLAPDPVAAAEQRAALRMQRTLDDALAQLTEAQRENYRWRAMNPSRPDLPG